MSDDPTTAGVFGGRYAVDRKLARGGMADIFLADDLVLERPVVIKTLLPQYAGDPAFIERFRREATSAAKLNHPNVVAVYDWGSHDDSYFMAMEYVEGESLGQVLQRTRVLATDRALEVTGEAAAGLGFAHANGMVHRDVKPGNIMITTTGEVKVADFGVARALDASDSLTQTGNVMGTAAYFSPEQARGEVVDPRSDLYSLGVVLFEMVTGRRPFSGTSPLSVAYKHVGEVPPAPSSVNGELPPAIDVVIATLLAKHPDDRYPDADHLCADLERIRSGGHPVGVPPTGQAATGDDHTIDAGHPTQPLTGPIAAPPAVDRPTHLLAAPPAVDRPTPPLAAPSLTGGPAGGGRERRTDSRALIAHNRPLLLALVLVVAIVGGLTLVLVGALSAVSGGSGDSDRERQEVDTTSGVPTSVGLPASGDAPDSPATASTARPTSGSGSPGDDEVPESPNSVSSESTTGPTDSTTTSTGG
ncbi:MAG: protein kinase, partial [Acidimicrobiia bacterium]|nr:protein kinase [Acidimicrobiia bacterium]